MKKLFTLFAFLAMFMGANAKEFVDLSVDYSQKGTSPVGWKADLIQSDWITADADGLHLYNPEVTPNFYDYQLWIIDGGSRVNLEVDTEYTITFVAKVSDGEATVRYRVGDWGGGIAGQIAVNSTEYKEYTVTGKATVEGCGLLVQFGDYVGTVSFKSVKITHEGKEEKPVQWNNLLTNGDAEGEYGDVACAFAKEYDATAETQPAPYPATIETLDGNKVFAVHAKAVDPPLTWDSDGEQWGQQHKAGDPMPDNAWQNQFWITLPEGIAAGTQLKVSFKVKASESGLKADIQTHRQPSDYLGGFTPGTIDITTDWTPYEFQFAAPDGGENGKFQSIAFNLGVSNQYNRDIDFYFDDLELSEMVLEHGFFVASANTGTDLTYDFDNATEFVEGEDPDGGECLVATVGKEGDEDSYVNEVMISTVRGNDKAFKSSTIKNNSEDGAILGQDPDDWKHYSSASSAKISLPSGVWKIYIAPDDGQILFMQIEGEVKEPVDIITNTAVITVNATEREYTAAEAEAAGVEAPAAPGAPWDNQFFIKANRILNEGEVTVVEFDYVATKDAKVTTQGHALPGTYRGGGCGDVNFTTTEAHFVGEFKVPAHQNNDIQSIAFNLSEIKDANNYTFKNFKWYLKDESLDEGMTFENLIDETGTENNFSWNVLTGIVGVINDFTIGSDVIYNLSGQRVTEDYKGVVIKNGRKVVNK